jgi:23S rRNA (adenine2503-C2)-methyltransferase
MTLRIVGSTGNEKLSRVFVGELDDGALVEFAESVQPPVPRGRKWILIVSTLKGCPIACPICDAGGSYRGALTAEEIHAQIDHLVLRRFPRGAVPVSKLKIQFARMGDPAFNDAVLEVLRQLPLRHDAPGLMPCISTAAPAGRERFFEELVSVKNELYPGGRFQMQFSIHTTCESVRRRLIPARIWSFAEIASWSGRFFSRGDRRITLNFAPAKGLPLDPHRLKDWFGPEIFAVKLTPINPTNAAMRSGLAGLIDPADPGACERIADEFRDAGYETILSIGEADENRIGSNCGMSVRALAT